MAGTCIFVMTEKTYRTLETRGMDLRCKCKKKGGEDCNKPLAVHDTVVSKPASKGRKYYLKSHYEKMMIDLNGGYGIEELDDIEDY